MDIISLNGQLLKAPDALISVDERGFRFGDGVFETIPVFHGKPYLLDYHLERLSAGLAALHIEYNIVPLPSTISEVIRANHAETCMVRLYVSRGIGSQGYLPVEPAPAPTVLLQLQNMPRPLHEPVTLWLSQWEKISPRALPVGVKLAQGVNATLARMEAREHGCHDALQQSHGGHISEASSANIFWLNEGTWFTPSLRTGALAGVTRRRMIELAGTVTEGEFTLETLQKAGGVCITNSAYGIVPVNGLDPSGFRWDSASVAAPLQALRKGDIARLL